MIGNRLKCSLHLTQGESLRRSNPIWQHLLWEVVDDWQALVERLPQHLKTSEDFEFFKKLSEMSARATLV